MLSLMHFNIFIMSGLVFAGKIPGICILFICKLKGACTATNFISWFKQFEGSVAKVAYCVHK